MLDHNSAPRRLCYVEMTPRTAARACYVPLDERIHLQDVKAHFLFKKFSVASPDSETHRVINYVKRATLESWIWYGELETTLLVV